MEAEDRDALYALYRGTAGDAWYQNTGWCTDAPLSEWHGVSVNEEGRVVGLDLRRNNLVGEIPKELGTLHNLQNLDLSDNKLTGEIPKELGTLHNLQNLEISDNKLTGAIPKELGTLHNLQNLNLSYNELTGAIPKELGSLHNLQNLNLSDNKLTGAIPKELGSLHNLQELILSDNKLTGAVPAQLVKLYNLWSLELDGNDFSGPLPSLKQLKDLFDALAREDSSDEGRIRKVASSTDEMETASTVVTTKTADVLLPESSVKSYRSFRRASEEAVSKVSARVSGFEGDVMAWSFSATDGVIGCADFEIEVPDMEREVPALIGQTPSKAEVVDGEYCLLHPIVTCLAGSEEIFNPPLLLRFPVGDTESMESGSDAGCSDAVEEDYCTSLKKRYSVVTREEGSSNWVPIVGTIKKMNNGMFVLEAQVAHFTDYALMQPVQAGQGRAKIVEIKRLPHESRRNVFLFANQGDETIVVFCWRPLIRRFWISRMMASFGIGPVEVSGEVDRDILDTPNNRVYSEAVDPSGELVNIKLSNTTSLEVAWTTIEERDGHRVVGWGKRDGYRSVTVWGWETMRHKTAMVFGRLRGKAYARVVDLRVANDEDVGDKVRATLDKPRNNPPDRGV